MYSSGTFQDLLNIDTTNENIEEVIDDLKALEEEVKDNTTAINVNSGLISTNTTNISNNGVLISNNTQQLALETLRITLNANEILAHDGEINTLQLERIADEARITINEQNITTNTNNIQTNTIALTTLGNDVLRKDGSVLLDVGYTPTLGQSISTKDYVDNSIGGSTQFLKIDGTNSMTGNLDMGSNNIINSGLINGFNLATFDSDITTLAINLGAETVRAINAEVALAGDITTNAFDINQLQTDIPTKLSRTGDFMTGTSPMGFGSSSKTISGQPGYLSIISDDHIHLITSANPTVRITQTYIENNLSSIFQDTVTLNSTVSSIDTTGDLIMNRHTIKKVQQIENDHNTGYNDIKINMASTVSAPKDVVTYDANNISVNDMLVHTHVPAQFDDRVNITHQVDALRFETNLSVFGNTIGQYTGSASVNGLQIKGYDSGSLSTSRYDGGNVGVRDSLTWNEYGDIDVRRNITLGGTIDGLDLQTMNSNISSNTSAINTNSTNISNNATNIATNLGNINSNYGLILTNQGNISTNTSNISSNATAINTKLPNSGSSITATTPFFKIDGGNNDCELRICADSLNNSGAKNPKIVFQQDGTVQTGAVFLGNNQLNISSSTASNAGIVFRTTNTAGGWETAPVRMMVENDGQVSIYTNLVVSSSKNFNVGSFRYYAYGGYGGFASGTINCAIRCLNGRCVAAEFDATSDRRCKTDIEDIPDEKIDNFMNLEAKQYYWKEEKENLKYGFIAQDVIQQDLMPCVNFVQSTGMMGGTDEITGVNNPADICMNLNYDSMIPLLQKALKKALDRIDILEQKINTLI